MSKLKLTNDKIADILYVKAVAEKKQEEGGEAPVAAPETAAVAVEAPAEAPAEDAAPAETPAE